MPQDLKKAYRTIMDDHFPERMEISFVFDDRRTTLVYEKVAWEIDGVRKGLRYGENPGQEAAFYKLVNGNLIIGNVTTIAPGRYLVSDAELLQFGKHPGKINLTDADNALNILRYLMDRPTAAIMKHNNPSGVAMADTIAEAYLKADLADHIAAFGGCIALNRPVDMATAEAIAEQYAEVVVAPEYEEGTVAVLAARKNLRIMRIAAIERLATFAQERFVDFKSLIDGGIIAQLSFVPQTQTAADLLPATATRKGETIAVKRAPTAQEIEDMLFGWKVEAGVTSNSVLYAKDGVTVGIGAGEQDRVGVAVIARDKAYRNMAERLAYTRYRTAYRFLDAEKQAEIDAEVKAAHGDLKGAAMISDAFFPFRDGVDVGLHEGVTAVIQPGGSLNDAEVIEAVNEAGATMVFTGQRSFKH
ncbi:MAG TPA: IMP cyclohydrolase [Anaerolineae bacterium]|nr:IMP cyclohydrolase [Anaerolineae bacterium]HQK14729.1 IMP cyclohydrolase [Anaerolineae bacterium]